MKFQFKRILIALLSAVLLLTGTALADSITFTGTVAASATYEVYAPIGGTVEAVNAEAGQKVSADDVLVQLATKKVYAEEAGVVTAVFGQPGDSADTVAQKYGAVVYLEGESVYTIDASTENAYNSTETKFVHVGESVYLVCYSDGKHTGTGVITAIQGTNFTVRVNSGEFLIGETVNVYRGTSATSTKRIGRGTLNRTSPTAVSGSGSIVSFAVASGDTVERGYLLFETLEGSFNGLYMSGSAIPAGVDGTISQINAQQGGNLQKDSVVAVIYPENAMRIEAQIEESNLAYIAVGDKVSIELLWNQDEEVTYDGEIAMISAIANGGSGNSASGESSVTYTVYIDFIPDANTRYGMTAIVTTLEDEEFDEEAEETEETEEADDAEPEDDPEGRTPPEEDLLEKRPEGFDPENMPEGFAGRVSADFPFGQEGMTDNEQQD